MSNNTTQKENISTPTNNVENDRAAHEKYLYKPTVGSSHLWAQETLKELIKGREKEVSILDFGSGGGDIGKVLRVLKVEELYAVEIDPETIEKTSHIYSDIKTSIDDYGVKKFDIILLMDIIEHLPNPQNFLISLASKLNSDGIVLISVPNIVHWSIRLMFSVGYFRYFDRGALDKTHLYFFTRKIVRDMVSKIPNAQITHESVSISPAEFAFPEKVRKNAFFSSLLNKFSNFRAKYVHVMPNLLGYQLLTVVKLSGNNNSNNQ